MKRSLNLKNLFRVFVLFIVGLGLVLFPVVGTVRADEETISEVQKTMILNKPGTVLVTTYYTLNLIIQTSAGYPELSGATYKVETGGMGSGFVVNPEGYILTNGHVVKSPDKELALTALYSAKEAIVADVVRAEFQRANGTIPSDAEIEALMPQVIQEIGGEEVLINELYNAYKAGEIKLDDIKRDVYVQSGAFISGKKIPIEKGMKADVKSVDFEGFTDEGEVLGKDIAIIKVPTNNMPTVQLADSSKAQVGDKIYIIGYPGAATFIEFLDKESQYEPTMTSGIVSALKTMKDGTQVFQTDAAVTHGNSGGPAFNEKGEVIGIASMVAIEGNQQKFGFSYLRPTNVAKEFMTAAGITNKSGLTDEAFKKGIEYYYSKKYSKAISEFEKALRLYPSLIGAQEYITKAQNKISSGEAGVAGSLGDISMTWWIIAGLAIIVIIVILVLLKFMRKEKKMEETVAGIQKDDSKK